MKENLLLFRGFSIVRFVTLYLCLMEIVLTLAVRYRPQGFSEVLGQETAVRIISNSLETSGPKIFMLSGTRGSGKTTLARLIASHSKIVGTDLLEIDGATYNKVGDVESIIIPFLSTFPRGERKMLILDECHMLSRSAWSALLKPLEELPAYMIIAFCTTEVSKLLATILSRCIDIRLPNVPYKSILSRLQYIAQQENIPVTSDSLEIISRMSDGSMREAISILESCYLYSSTISPDVVWKCTNQLSDQERVNFIRALQDNDLVEVQAVLDKTADLMFFFEVFIEFCSYEILAVIKKESKNFNEKDLSFLKFLLKKCLNLQLKFSGCDISINVLIKAFFLTLVQSEQVKGTATESNQVLGVRKVLDTCGFVKVW